MPWYMSILQLTFTGLESLSASNLHRTLKSDKKCVDFNGDENGFTSMGIMDAIVGNLSLLF